jgi:catechol 2,3-dioxygenase-like lactoylglutathione lyase family enzyme
MTSFQRVMLVLRVADLGRGVEWYTRALGFRGVLAGGE